MFNTSISGLNGSQKFLDTTSNNIANVNSYGFKRSRAEFADIYTNTVFSNSHTATGMGTTTTTVAQQFVQGSLTGDTGNNLDMAISGNGFFVLANEANNASTANMGDRTYTRNGAFEINPNGYIVTAMGDFLQGYDVDTEGNISNLDLGSTKAIHIPSSTGAPKMSTKIGIDFNLPANSQELASDVKYSMQAFDPDDRSTYTAATSQTIYDSLGGAHTLTYYFVKDHTNSGQDYVDQDGTLKTAPDNGHTIWNVVTFVDGNPTNLAGDDAQLYTIHDGTSSLVRTADNGHTPGDDYTIYGMRLEFGTDGKLVDGGQLPNSVIFANDGPNAVGAKGATSAYTLAGAMGGGVSNDQVLSANLGYTQYGSSKFNVSNITNDGYATGILENVEVNEHGLIVASYTNGRTEYICKVAMANFTNPQGLLKVGDTQWKESINSGEVQAQEANTGMCGAIKGANLELSNVELASELVDLIIAQRAYQANAQALQTQNTAMDSIMNIR